MSSAAGRLERDVVPRWRSVSDTIVAGDLLPLANSAASLRPSKVDLDRLEGDWLDERSEAFASDFVGSALLLGERERPREAAQFLSTEGSTDRLRHLGRVALAGHDSRLPFPPSGHIQEFETARHEMSRLKRSVVRDPRNALAWIELARYYAARGQWVQAERALRVALQTAPNNRFLLRSAACFYFHKDARAGHDLLLQADNLVRDPWLLAAELALANAAGRKPRHMKAARSMLSDGGIAPIHLTELASQVATIELRSGGDRKARRLFAAALQDPTENSLAQVEWASQRMTGLEVVEPLLAMPLAAEARSRHEMERGDWRRATENARQWLSDQPFSDDAALLGSYVASVGLRDWKLSEEFADRGLLASPGNQMLLNNRAYALLEQDRIEDARKALVQIRLDAAEDVAEVAILATHGLLGFRSGDAASGRLLYERAIARARVLGRDTHLAMASVMLAREELLAGSEEAPRAIREAERLARRVTNRAVKQWLSDLKDMVPGQAPSRSP